MRIAQVAPLHESVPPKFYGGTERIVSYLTEELVRRGHTVTLFASGDSETSARLVASRSKSLRLDDSCRDPFPHHILQLEHVLQEEHQFDIVHFHTDHTHFPLARRFFKPNVTTLHGRLDLPDIAELYTEFADLPLVSISNAQRRPLPFQNWEATVYHGLPLSQYRFVAEPGAYLAFLGRTSPEKQPDEAIAIAKRAGLPLKIAAKIDPINNRYFDTVVKPLLDDPLIEFLGEIGEAEKPDFLGHALALLVPINWPEPFGLVIIESMACGTPVIAYRCGSVPELITDGRDGFVVNNVAGAVRALQKLTPAHRQTARATFEQRFSVKQMTDNYLAVYQRLLMTEPSLAVG